MPSMKCISFHLLYRLCNSRLDTLSLIFCNHLASIHVAFLLLRILFQKLLILFSSPLQWYTYIGIHDIYYYTYPCFSVTFRLINNYAFNFCFKFTSWRVIIFTASPRLVQTSAIFHTCVYENIEQINKYMDQIMTCLCTKELCIFLLIKG